MNVGILIPLLEDVDKFINTPVAHKMGMTSRCTFFEKLGYEFFANYDQHYKHLSKLFNTSLPEVSGYKEVKDRE